MNYRFLDKTNLLVSEIGFGCMSLGDDQSHNENLIHRAIDQGINFFDTADLYQQGQNEVTLGKSLIGKRKQVLISSKVGNRWRSDGSGWDWHPNKEYILAAADLSLSRLQTDYLDLYLLHGGTLEDPMDETIQAFEILQQQGKILQYGISSIRPNVIREYVKRSRMVCVMMQYSLLDRRPEESCFSFLAENQIGILARGSLAKGILGNKEPTDYLNYKKEEVAGLTQVLQDLQEGQRTMAQTSLRFVLQHPVISSVVVGLRTPEQLEEAIGTTNSSPLSADDIKKLQQAIEPNRYDQHR
jgi:aryl-alcohol dehydrogenase-like predicted oxidoreductase